jgi:hypothetical protein
MARPVNPEEPISATANQAQITEFGWCTYRAR